MKDVTLQPINERVSIKTDTRVLDTLLAKNCNVMMACGGQGICATCHVYINKGMESLTPMGDRERRTLGLITGAGENSRLSCQCRVLGEGVEVQLPEGMYVQSFNDLESLIGKRSQVAILHPADGRILIEKGKFITRTSIMQLSDVDFDFENLEISDR
ncbi:MAG: (2Fe-2S)-binding protein [Opitutales bacterium]|nr:(2Fe-2S)-binding protein [Opitutales bacterium]MCH8539432.1 (2Fe-2S)-binding protein [Opitutales bacterium]